MAWGTVTNMRLEERDRLISEAGDFVRLLRLMADEIERGALDVRHIPCQFGPPIQWSDDTVCLCLLPYSRVKAAQAGGQLLLPLTARQREVLQELVKGHTAKAIARTLGISTRTVEAHLQKIYRTTKAKRTTQLMEIVFSQLD